jgi:hypothetical protein
VRKITLAATLLTILAPIVPARADRNVSDHSSSCGRELCAEAWAAGKIDCDQVADDTVTCSGEIGLYARVNYTGWPYLRFPGEATWGGHMGCGWFVVGGQDQNCDFSNTTETKSWEMNDLHDSIFQASGSFGPVSHTSADPFCLFMYLDAGSGVQATSTVLGLADYDHVETGAGFFEQGDIACASGGTPP